MSRLFSYVVRYDSGFAPNPFYGSCTLATCKPDIRRSAQPKDWVVGTGSADRWRDRGTRLVHAMKVGEAMDFRSFWDDPRFAGRNRNDVEAESRAAVIISTIGPPTTLNGCNWTHSIQMITVNAVMSMSGETPGLTASWSRQTTTILAAKGLKFPPCFAIPNAMTFAGRSGGDQFCTMING